MRARLAALAIVLGGCNALLGLDPASQGGDGGGDDDPTVDGAGPCVDPHDEDGDGAGDRCDVCPHLADDQADRDGDGVGDLCDPDLDVEGERWLVFDGFGGETLDDGWQADPGILVGGDVAALVDPAVLGVGLTWGARVRERERVRIAAAVEVIEFVAGGGAGSNRRYGLRADAGPSGAAYTCELLDDVANDDGAVLRITRETSSTSLVLSEAPFDTSKPIGFRTLSLEQRPSEDGALVLTCTDSTLGGIFAEDAAPLPPGQVGIFVQGVTMQVQWFAAIATP